MSRIEIENDDQWHALRAKHIGGSEIGALFGVSPYTTAWSLWHEKAGKVAADDIKENDRMRWGKILEPLIGAEVGRKLNWSITPARHYYSSDEHRGMGATLDFDVVDHQWGPGVVETKVVFGYGDYKRDWTEDRAPAPIELQMQHQLAGTGYAWGAIAVWVAETCSLMPALIRRPDPRATNEIIERVKAFWKSIDDGTPPDVTGTDQEAAIIRELYPAREPKKVVDIPDEALTNACQQYLWASEQLPGLVREKDSNKVRLIAAAKDAEILRVPGFNVFIKQNKRGAITLDIKTSLDSMPMSEPQRSTLQSG